jgi:hypothetical protein
MTARLREVLHQAAQDVPTYAVYDRAVASARRSRRRTMVAATAAAMLGALVLVLLPTGAARYVDTAAQAPAALPNRIGGPVLGALHAADRPRLGPAAVLFSGGFSNGLCMLADECDATGVVGASADRYRVFVTDVPEAPSGEQVVLSPDGRHVAYSAGHDDRQPHVAIIDLGSGHTDMVASAMPGSIAATPVGWSRDGRRLAIRDTVPIDAQRSGYDSVLSIVDLGTRQWLRLGTGRTYDGFTVAFAPDQRRFAYQIGTTVTVGDLNGGSTVSFGVAGDAALAGKGAWTPDGAAVAIVQRQGEVWTLRYVDPATGQDTSRPATPSVSGVTAIRLLGWSPNGSAVVLAYQPQPGSPARLDQPLPMDQRTHYGNVRAIRILALTPGATTPTVLLEAPDHVKAVDVADDIVASGRTRPAHPPRGVGPRFWFWTTLSCTIALAVVLFRRRWVIVSGPRRWPSVPNWQVIRR